MTTSRPRQALDAEDIADGQLLMVRLSDLAGINRRLGRAATDDFLRRCGDLVSQCAGNPQGIGARLNGADFSVMLPGESNGRAVAERLLGDLVTVAAPYGEGKAAAALGFGRYGHGMDPARCWRASTVRSPLPKPKGVTVRAKRRPRKTTSHAPPNSGRG